LNRTLKAVLAAAAVATVLASCTASPQGDPQPATRTGTPVPTTSSEASGGGEELDIAKYASAPCTILTSAQQAELTTFRESEAAEVGTGPNCTYRGKDVLENSTFVVNFMTKAGKFEDSLEESSKKFPVFRETEVAGLPAFSFDSADGKRDCNTSFRTSDKDYILVQGSMAKNDKLNDGNPCATTERVAATIVGNLRG
jgi:Protein of unknown function (DUF3558)